ncbi:uncharacterized protein LOC109251063 [Panthera pardus]|uniref:Uncharacterized protein LOC109251063 n=1 Tax=Panthera pardus TaxID=9691 RepID=A0A9V1EB28_PANPR|nr:uncharacterized protein LOC109251063 [Panthera pardus]
MRDLLPVAHTPVLLAALASRAALGALLSPPWPGVPWSGAGSQGRASPFAKEREQPRPVLCHRLPSPRLLDPEAARASLDLRLGGAGNKPSGGYLASAEQSRPRARSGTITSKWSLLLARDFGGDSRERGRPSPPRRHLPLTVPVTQLQRPPGQMPEVEGLETSARNDLTVGASLLPRISRSTFGRDSEGFGRAQRNASARPAAREQMRLPSRIPAVPPRLGPGPRRGAPGSVSENKALRFQPKVKVHHERVFSPPPESESDSVSPNKPPINQLPGPPAEELC